VNEDESDAALRRTLDRLALSEWSEAAEACVDSVFVVGERAAVVLLLNGYYEYSVYFQRAGRRNDARLGPAPSGPDPEILLTRHDATGGLPCLGSVTAIRSHASGTWLAFAARNSAAREGRLETLGAAGLVG
jgi:hypothetical protein